MKSTVYPNGKDRPRLRRPCIKCEKYFQPKGRYVRLCPDCIFKVRTRDKTEDEKR